MPRARRMPDGMMMEDGLPLRDYAAAFLAEFGVGFGVPGDHAVFKDVTGEELTIAETMLRSNRNSAQPGKLKLGKGKRKLYMPLLAHTLKHPDEKWEDSKRGRQGKMIPHWRYLARWKIAGGQDVYGVSVFEFVENEWRGVTTFDSLNPGYVESRIRVGKRVYVRRK